MSRATSSDTRYLERKDGKFRVVVSVPRSLQREMGTKLKQALYTDSLASANTLKWQVVAEMKAKINAALKRGGKDPLVREALTIAALRSRAQTPEDHDNLDAAVSIRLDQIAGLRSPFSTSQAARLCTNRTRSAASERKPSPNWHPAGPRLSPTTIRTASRS